MIAHTTTPAVPMYLSDLDGTYIIDPTHSTIGFVARHAMITKVRGAFTEFNGTFSVTNGDPASAAASITIATATIDTRNSARDDHLRSADFFDAATNPDITFRSTHATQTGPTTASLHGDLTVKGTTKTVTVELTFTGAALDPYGNLRVGFAGSGSLQRSDFGLTFNATLETGGVLISDAITLEFEVSAIAAPPHA